MNVTCFNPVIIRILYFIFLTILINIGSYSQQINTEKIDFKNLILKKNIKSVKLHLEGWELSEPVMILNSDTKLILSFDDLGTEINDYSYTIIHCNSEWEPENLFMEEYIDGYHEGYIANYKKSFNTTYNYFHYSLTIPNQDMSIKISGNYCIVVYQNYNPDDIVLIKRFCVVENLVEGLQVVLRGVVAFLTGQVEAHDASVLEGDGQLGEGEAQLRIDRPDPADDDAA